MERLPAARPAAFGRQRRSSGEMPLDFLPVAEDVGIIVDIGYLVLEDACSLLSRWRDARLHDLSVTVNVSPRQLTETHLKANVAQILQTHDVDPRLLVVDVSEAALELDDPPNGILAELHTLGLRLALDDFGSGRSRYAPMNALRRLPVDIVKLDLSVVADLGKTEMARDLMEAALAFTQQRGLTTIAEGVERATQLELLCALDCDQAQGYLLGTPQPASAVTALATDQTSGARSPGRKPEWQWRN